jgi:hypothetical protein
MLSMPEEVLLDADVTCCHLARKTLACVAQGRIVADPRGGEPSREARANYAAMFDTHIAVRLGSVAFRELTPDGARPR